MKTKIRPEVEQPGLGQLRQQHQRQHQQHRADDGPEEGDGAAEEGEQQVAARTRGTDEFGGHDLEVQRAQRAGDAHEEARGHEGEETHTLGVVADELDTLGVVAHGVQDAAERRAREGEHRRGADEAVGHDQVVELDLRPEADAEERRPDDAVARDAAFAAEKVGQHQRHRPHQFTEAERDHRERRARLAGRDKTEQRREEQPRGAADQRQQADGQRQLVPADIRFSVCIVR